MSANTWRYFWPGVLLTFVSCTWPQAGSNFPTAERIRADALAQAKQEGKLVLLVFGTHDKSWSDRLDQYHADTQVNNVLCKYFVLARIDIDETPGGLEMYLEHAPRNAPAFSILDAKGLLLSDSGEGEQNIGFPNNPEQVDRYIAALKSACSQITDEEVTILRGKLEQMRIAPPE